MNAVDEDWKTLLGLLPPDWERAAHRSGAVARLRGFDSVNEILRTLLLHVGCGYSLRETVVRAKAAGIAEVSDVTLLNRLRQAETWLQGLCQELLKENGVQWPGPELRRQVRAVDATVIKEPGKTGSQWRVHFSLRLPELHCDFFQITATEGLGTAEHLRRFPAAAGDIILGDRGYSHSSGIAAIYNQGADVIVRVNPCSLPLYGATEQPLAWLPKLRKIRAACTVHTWPVWVHEQPRCIAGRLCAVRKSKHAMALAQRRLTARLQKQQRQIKPETREYAGYVLVFTTLRECDMGAQQVLEYYRFRWQIELVFKRLKSILAMGHLPKYDEKSARAWLYGKLLVALLTQKLAHLGAAFSPWGCLLWPAQNTQPLA
jgi:hypothetical protein